MSTVKTPTVFALVSDAPQVERAVYRFRDAAILADSISLLYPNAPGTNELSAVNSTKAPEGAVVGGAALGVLGGVGGFLLGIGMLVIPGVGPFLAAGPVMTALSGAALGAGAGGISGGLIGFGLTEYEAGTYGENIRKGKTLMAVRCIDSVQAKEVRGMFEEIGATDISTTNTTTGIDQQKPATIL